MTDIQYGVMFPAGVQTDYELASYTRCVEALGFDSIWVVDIVYSDTQALDCLTALAFMAANSTTLTIGTSVMLLPLRNPILTAKAVSSLDTLSAGRVTLGIGVGEPASHTAVGCDPRTRGRRCEEGLVLLKRLWTEDSVTHQGEFYQTDGYTLAPTPRQSPHPPIWIGGHSEAAMARAARYADGFISIGPSPENCGAKFDLIDAKAKTHGKAPLTHAVNAFLCFDESRDAAAKVGSKTISERLGYSFSITDTSAHLFGTTANCIETLEEFIAVGATHFIIDPVCPTEETLAQVERLANEVLAVIR